MIEILELVEDFVQSPAFVNLLAALFLVYGIYEKIKNKISKLENNDLKVSVVKDKEEMKELKKELVQMKQMFLVAFNSSKIAPEVKLKLAELAEGKDNFNLRDDVFKPISNTINKKFDIKEKKENIKDDLLSRVSDAIKENKGEE